MQCVKVLKKDAQQVKQDLIEKKLLLKDYRSVKEEDFVYFPVSESVEGFEMVDKDCEKVEKVVFSLSSFDQVGDIVIVGEDVSDNEAKELLVQKSVKVVLRKKGIHHGEFRTQDLEFVCGEKRKETLYKENGAQMKLDVEQCYFSSRLSTERRRVADLVKDGENVLVLFSGVGPYPLVIAKNAKPALIVGVEKNPVAHKYAVENCEKYSNIKLYNLDAKDFVSDEKFDRVVIPLPKSAEEFLDVALKFLKKEGVVHFYDFVQEKEFPEVTIEKIKKKIGSINVLQTVKCGPFAPGRFRVCVDFSV